MEDGGETGAGYIAVRVETIPVHALQIGTADNIANKSGPGVSVRHISKADGANLLQGKTRCFFFGSNLIDLQGSILPTLRFFCAIFRRFLPAQQGRGFQPVRGCKESRWLYRASGLRGRSRSPGVSCRQGEDAQE